jgi:AcrR family transcriptional regulator
MISEGTSRHDCREVTRRFGVLDVHKQSAAMQRKNETASRPTKRSDRIERSRVDKFSARRIELAEAALETLAELGYARTSLREIAQKSEFTHGVLHYYFSDKVDLICCCVRHYKSKCVTRYDQITSAAQSRDELMKGFLEKLGETVRDEAPMHRLWYDLRSQSLFEEAFRDDVAEIDKSLEDMVWRVASRFASLGGRPVVVSRRALYALFDGLFQRCLLQHLSGDRKAIADLQEEVRRLLPTVA